MAQFRDTLLFLEEEAQLGVWEEGVEQKEGKGGEALKRDVQGEKKLKFESRTKKAIERKGTKRIDQGNK